MFCFSRGPMETIKAHPCLKPLCCKIITILTLVATVKNKTMTKVVNAAVGSVLRFLPKFISATLEENAHVSRLHGSKAPGLNMDEKHHIHPPSKIKNQPDVVKAAQTSAWPGCFVH